MQESWFGMAILQVFEWCAWDGFLITHVMPTAQRIPVAPTLLLPGADEFDGTPLLHINLTQPGRAFRNFDAWLTGFERAARPVLNGYFGSIDKWAIQAACKAQGLPDVRADRGGNPAELLVMKARANHYGRHERSLSAAIVGDMAPPPWPYPERVHCLPRSAIPITAWDDPRMTIERYISNRDDCFIRAYVAGDYVAAVTSHATGLVKEMDQTKAVGTISSFAGHERTFDCRDPLFVAHRLAQAMRVDFGALDLAVDDDGLLHAIDLNTTPAWGFESNLNPRLISELGDAVAGLAQVGSRFCPAQAD